MEVPIFTPPQELKKYQIHKLDLIQSHQSGISGGIPIPPDLMLNSNSYLMEIDIDFSELSQRNGDYPDKITQAEVVSVLKNPRHSLSPIDGYPLRNCYTIACGYSSKKRILLVVSMIEYPKRKILQMKVADEDEIDQYYCGKT